MKINNNGNRVDYAPALLRRASISSNSAAQYMIKQNWDGREWDVFRYKEVADTARATFLRHKQTLQRPITVMSK